MRRKAKARAGEEYRGEAEKAIAMNGAREPCLRGSTAGIPLLTISLTSASFVLGSLWLYA